MTDYGASERHGTPPAFPVKFPRFFDVAKIIDNDVVCMYYLNKYYYDLMVSLWRTLISEDRFFMNDEIIYDIGLKIFNRGSHIALSTCLNIFISVMYILLVKERDDFLMYDKLKQKLFKAWEVDWDSIVISKRRRLNKKKLVIV